MPAAKWLDSLLAVVESISVCTYQLPSNTQLCPHDFTHLSVLSHFGYGIISVMLAPR